MSIINKKMVEAKFNRNPTTEQMDALQIGWFAISYKYISDKKARRKLHGQWCRVQTKYGSVYRVMKFSTELKGLADNSEDGEILIDWHGWLKLTGYGECEKEAIQVNVRKAYWWEYFHLGLSHPDPTYRQNSVLALIGLFLGIVSMITPFL